VQNGVGRARVVRFWLDDAFFRVARVEILESGILISRSHHGVLDGEHFIYIAIRNCADCAPRQAAAVRHIRILSLSLGPGDQRQIRSDDDDDGARPGSDGHGERPRAPPPTTMVMRPSICIRRRCEGEHVSTRSPSRERDAMARSPCGGGAPARGRW